MRRLPAPTCLLRIALAPMALTFTMAPARADTTISTATTANQQTSTANAGAADNLVISSTGSIAPPAGTAITIDSNNTVSNAGSITASGIDGVIAIGGGGGFASGIVNTGTITIDETYAAADANSDGVVDGPFASGSSRYGIRLSGTGAFTGAINSSGAITIKGNDSGGIFSSVPIIGSVTTSAAITVTGDRGYGIRLGDVSGNVTVAGTVAAIGQSSVGVALTGDIGGSLVVHSSISATGYSSTTLPTTLTSLGADNLLQGGAALAIGGNVAGGVLIATTTTSTDTTLDTDGDGIVDTSEGTGTVVSTGSAPALLIGSATRDVTLGLVPSRTVGLAIDGGITAAGIYAGFDATAVRIGGLGGAVGIAGGATVLGSVSATSNGATATGIAIGAGATLPSLVISGSVGASSGTNAGGAARGIVIETGASLPTITNAGAMTVGVTTGTGMATGILDASGTLATLTNSGSISVSDAAGTGRAIDVSANVSGFSYVQALASSTATAPFLTGAIVTGGGNDSIAASAGTLTSAATLGAGNDQVALSGTAAWTGTIGFGTGDDSLSLADTARFVGTVDFGTGADTLTIGSGAAFSGQILDTIGHTNVTVTGGTLALTNAATSSIGSLAINGGTLGVTIDPASGAHSLLAVAGATTITGVSTVKVTLSTLGLGTGSFTVLTSGTLSGSANFGLSIDALPYLLTGSVTGNDAAGTVTVNLLRKSATELGFRRSEAAAYDAVYAAIAGNSALTGLFLGLTDRDTTLRRYRQMLPDHAGGLFDALSGGERLVAPGASAVPWKDLGSVSLWVQEAQWNNRQHAEDTPGYSATGFGLSAGGDVDTGGFGRIGLSLGFIYGDVKNGGGNNEVTASLFQGGAYWLTDWGGFHFSANGSFGGVVASSVRSIGASTSASGSLLTSNGDWNGTMLSAGGKASWEAHLGAFYLRPAATISYAKLHEQAHDETGGGTGFDLSIDGRNSDELAATGTVALGLHLGKQTDEDSIVGHVEIEGGRREILGGTIGATTARFTGGNDFTLLPEDRTSGFTGGVNASIGSSTFRFVAGVNAEQREGYRSLSGQLGLRSAF
ncbi:autotransporter outer membrane beta-barrel domain-containing protein [Sphingomonas sp. BIUV-7]|uniref:Autotransporter outer membrane beta-barrel domain-containing protein n=1 Tax=Sphingomonas natans TaxID=3063330 RepID=A0ABT8YA80_9SPHN|nr:autotransporter outer membrane beta-barrel domain-containing protein [Sphingomonas sp. BIUV-7]MDO6414897.1 autotransporter outer membrane beta-barrel domain-containing protein [Sphingomonas sp. BIUV-7]